MALAEEQLNRHFAASVGLTVAEVEHLRGQFRNFGRNPLASTLEILAIENGYDEQKVKALFDMHLAQMRRNDGLPTEKKTVYD